VICLSATMPGGSDQLLLAIHAVQREWPPAAFIVGGNGLTSRVQARQGIDVCRRVSEAVDAADALIKHADLN
jgi:hypothetical protein